MGVLDLLFFPAATSENNNADRSDGGFGDDDGEVSALGLHVQGNGENVCEWNFQEPEPEEIHDCGSDSIACSIKGLEHDHTICVADVAVADNAKTAGGERNDLRVVREKADDRLGKRDEEDAEKPEEDQEPREVADELATRRLPRAPAVWRQGFGRQGLLQHC